MIDKEGNIVGYVPGMMTKDIMVNIIKQTLDTTANTSFKEVTHSPKKENIRVDSIILFVMIVALVAALILLKILLGKRKK